MLAGVYGYILFLQLMDKKNYWVNGSFYIWLTPLVF